MQSTNKLILDLTDDEALRDYLADKSVGDECRLELTLMLDESTGGQAVFSVKKVEAEEDYSDKESDPEGAKTGPLPEGEMSKGDATASGDSPEVPMLDGSPRPKGGAAVLSVFRKKK